MTPAILILLILSFSLTQPISTSYIISQSTQKICAKDFESPHHNETLICTTKILVEMEVPSATNGKEFSIVQKLSTIQWNSSHNVTLRKPLTITVTTSPVDAVYHLQYVKDVDYKPQEWTVRTRKCEPGAGFDVVKHCKRFQDPDDFFIMHTEPICCPCGDDVNHRRKPSSCGNTFDRIMKGKISIAHCARFSKDMFMVFSVGQYSIGFSVRIEVKTGFRSSEVIIGPNNRSVISRDKYLQASILGNLIPFESIPSFEEDFLVIPRPGSPGQPQDLGSNISRWMLIDRARFSLNGLECDKIGVFYQAFQQQKYFCSAPFWSCLKNQLWNFWEADQIRISRKQKPLNCLQGRFQRLNEHPGAGPFSFSIGVTEVLKTALLLEISADDIK